jgi:hypothetical protein
MKRLALIAAAMLSASALSASELNTISAGDIKISKIAIPAPVLQPVEAAKCNHVTVEITSKLYLMPQTSKSLLFTYAKNEAEFKEFTALWTPILNKFGMKVTGTEYKNEFGILNYESPEGLVVRDFLAEDMNYDALSSTTIVKLQHELLEPLEQAGMTPIAALNIKNEVFRPTFKLYYLTKPDANIDHEVQLRQLKNGEDIDFDLLANSVKLVKKDASFSMVYIGKLLGFKSKLATDTAAAAVSLENYKKFLAENKKEFIASKVLKLDEPFTSGDHTFNYLLNMYFFQ